MNSAQNNSRYKTRTQTKKQSKGMALSKRTPNKRAIVDVTTENDINCGICLSELQNPVHTGSCNHEFCEVCLKAWAQTSTTCPICRKAFTVIKYKHQSRKRGREEEHVKPTDKRARIYEDQFYEDPTSFYDLSDSGSDSEEDEDEEGYEYCDTRCSCCDDCEAYYAQLDENEESEEDDYSDTEVPSYSESEDNEYIEIITETETEEVTFVKEVITID